jgi:integration host factor subunit beta
MGFEMIKSELITAMSVKLKLPISTMERVVNVLLNTMTDGLSVGQRIEVRGFGNFSVKTRSQKTGRNPRTGESVTISKRSVVRFKAGLDLAQRVKDSVKEYKITQ